MLAVELCDGSSCRGCMFSFVQDVSQAVPVAMSQIHQQHMRTRLYLCNLGELHMYLKSNTLNNGTKGANWLKVWTMGQIGYLHNGSGADPGFFLEGSALVSCSTSTPINHFFFLQNTSCIRKPQVIFGARGGVCAPPAPSP